MGRQFVVCEHSNKFDGGCNFHQIVFTSQDDALDYIIKLDLLGKAVIYKLELRLHKMGIHARDNL